MARTPRGTRVQARGSSRSRWPIVALIALVAMAAAVFVLARRPPAVRREAGLNVLLITIDTLRYDALGAYGNTIVSTPWIDRLARTGVRFERAYAHNVVTLPSHANILSGRYPFDHGVRENAGFRFPASQDTLATLLRARGYRTGAFVSAFPLDSRFGLTRGFDVYDDGYGEAESHNAFLMQERRGSETVARAARWIAGAGASPYFCWLHLYDPHFPYDPPPPFAERFRDQPYLGEVSAVDAALEPLLRPILDAGEASRTLVVLTADHGESLGEHGEQTHGLFAYDATLRVPLIVHEPRLLASRVVSQLARHVDLLPTVLDALALETPAGLPGRSLLPAAAGGPAVETTSYFEALSASLNRGWAPLTGVLRDYAKYIELPLPELYDLAADPRERDNLEPKDPARVASLRALLQQYGGADPHDARIAESRETAAALRSLGYVTGAGGSKTSYGVEDDPKRLIALDTEVHEIVTKYQAGDLAGALELCRRVVAARPTMPLTLLYEAFLTNELGDARASIDATRRALALNTADASVAALLGAYLTEAGKAAEAAEALRSYVTRPEPDLDAVIAYGVALAQSGRATEAIEAFERAREIDPTNAMALVNIGTVHLMEGRTQQAATEFVSALEIDPSVARAHNSLGVIAAREGRYDEAIGHWRQAVALDPRDFQTLYNLGTLLVKLGRPQEARPYFDAYVRSAPPTVESADLARIKRWLAQ